VFSQALIMDETLPKIFGLDTERYFPVKLVRRQFGDGKEYVHAEPFFCEDWPEERFKNRHVMFGGNFLYSCDSRFREICSYPIPIHDRIEE